MIRSRKELSFFLKADRMMNRGQWYPQFKDFFKELILPDNIMRFLSAMRHVDYYTNSSGIFNKLMKFVWSWRYQRLSLKLGFSIGPCVFGYGLVIHHYGTIIVGRSNRIGNYAVLHTSTCIVEKRSIIGDGLFMSTGAVISNQVSLGDSVTIGVNSVVCKSINQSNILLTGAPAEIKKDSQAWYLREGDLFTKRFESVETLKASLAL